MYFLCYDESGFGDPFPGVTSKGCCYRNNNLVYNSSNDNASWTKIAQSGNKFNTNGSLAYVRYK